jgi:aspartyl protease family protein
MTTPRTFFPALLLLCAATSAQATDVSVVGLFPGKAVLVVNNAAPKAYSVGAIVADDVKLLAATQTSATLEINGKRQNFALGEHFNRRAPSGPASVTLQADGQGHFITQSQINGGTVRVVIDTGATNVSLSSTDAIRLGIDYKKGQIALSETANGIKQVYLVKLDKVKIGDIELNQVDGSIHEGGLQIGLLGMSFLNRTEMRREGQQMTLTKRY